VQGILPDRRRRRANSALASTLTRATERRGWVLDSAPARTLTAISELVCPSDPLPAVLDSGQLLNSQRAHSARDTEPDAQLHRRERQMDHHRRAMVLQAEDNQILLLLYGKVEDCWRRWSGQYVVSEFKRCFSPCHNLHSASQIIHSMMALAIRRRANVQHVDFGMPDRRWL
jgi:hypothetical protein